MSVFKALEFDLVHWLNDSVAAAPLLFMSLKDLLQNLVHSYYVADFILVAMVFTLAENKINLVLMEFKFQRVEKDS